jgi:hypothetical protein
MVSGEHDRSRLEAAGLLACVARVPEHAARIWAAAGPSLVSAMLVGGGCIRRSSSGGGGGGGSGTAAAASGRTPGWAGARRLQRAAALALKALIKPSEWEPEAVRRQRRIEVLQWAGGLGPLLAMVGGGAAAPGAAGGGECNGGGAAGSQELVLAAAACLRSVVLVPEAAQAAAGECDATRPLMLCGWSRCRLCLFAACCAPHRRQL